MAGFVSNPRSFRDWIRDASSRIHDPSEPNDPGA